MAPRSLGFVHEKNMKSLVIWVFDPIRRQKDLEMNVWNAAELQLVIEEMERHDEQKEIAEGDYADGQG